MHKRFGGGASKIILFREKAHWLTLSEDKRDAVTLYSGSWSKLPRLQNSMTKQKWGSNTKRKFLPTWQPKESRFTILRDSKRVQKALQKNYLFFKPLQILFRLFAYRKKKKVLVNLPCQSYMVPFKACSGSVKEKSKKS